MMNPREATLITVIASAIKTGASKEEVMNLIYEFDDVSYFVREIMMALCGYKVSDKAMAATKPIAKWAKIDLIPINEENGWQEMDWTNEEAW